MKKILFAFICFTGFGLEAAHFSCDVTVTPVSQTQQYLAEVQIKKVSDLCLEPELVACPKLVCQRGEHAHFSVESEDHADILSVQVFIPQNIAQTGVQTSIFMKENHQIVLSLDHRTRISDQ